MAREARSRWWRAVKECAYHEASVSDRVSASGRNSDLDVDRAGGILGSHRISSRFLCVCVCVGG
jgi:hypothetical protein